MDFPADYCSVNSGFEKFTRRIELAVERDGLKIHFLNTNCI